MTGPSASSIPTSAKAQEEEVAAATSNPEAGDVKHCRQIGTHNTVMDARVNSSNNGGTVGRQEEKTEVAMGHGGM